MSSNSNSKPPTNGETGSTLGSKMASAGSGMIGVIIFSLVFIIYFSLKWMFCTIRHFNYSCL